LRGVLAVSLGAKIGADARGLSATIGDSGTSGDKCLDERSATQVPASSCW
jgi:hypothetical protein